MEVQVGSISLTNECMHQEVALKDSPALIIIESDMASKRVVAVFVVAAAVSALIFSVKSMETAELMHEAADEFTSNFEFFKDGLYVDFSLDALRIAQEPHRTLFLIYSVLSWSSGAATICCLLYASRDSMLEAVRRLSKGF